METKGISPSRPSRPSTHRSIPNVVALVIPPSGQAPRSESRLQKARTRAVGYSPDPTDVHKVTIVLAIDALTAIVNLTLSLIGDDAQPDSSSSSTARRKGPQPPLSYQGAARTWIAEVRDSLDEIEGAMVNGTFDREIVTCETDGVSNLEESLNSMPDLDVCNPAPPDSCTGRLLAFWLNDIRSRGWDLYHICILAVDVLRARDDLQKLNSIQLPMR